MVPCLQKLEPEMASLSQIIFELEKIIKIPLSSLSLSLSLSL
jgi:hypothetical protein